MRFDALPQNKDTDIQKEVEKFNTSLSEPFIPDLPEYSRKIRNNLFFISALTIIMLTLDIKLDTERSTLFGLSFTGLDMYDILIVDLVLISYFLIHFIWINWDSYHQ